jgi:hypothetical protein
MEGRSLPLRDLRSLRIDAWWLAPSAGGAALILFAVYVAWAVWQNEYYYAAPYLSPLYSPCLSSACLHSTVPLFDGLEGWSPALFVLWVPLGLRATCYYYRKVYYRAFLLAPAACAVPDAASSYSGESRFPLVLQNVHRYFFYLSLPILGVLWWDALRALFPADGFAVGVGALLLLTNAALLTLFAGSCNSCRHVVGGHLKSFHGSPVRHALWRLSSRLNERHGPYAWASLAAVVLADLYIRLLASGVFTDYRLF